MWPTTSFIPPMSDLSLCWRCLMSISNVGVYDINIRRLTNSLVSAFGPTLRGPFHYRFFDHDGVIFFGFYQNGVRLKKITNLDKSCQFGTTSYAEVVPIRHDFYHVILKSCQLGRLQPCHIEVVPTWHDFCPVMQKSCQHDFCHIIIFF